MGLSENCNTSSVHVVLQSSSSSSSSVGGGNSSWDPSWFIDRE